MNNHGGWKSYFTCLSEGFWFLISLAEDFTTRFYSLRWALTQVKFSYIKGEFCLVWLSRSFRVLSSWNIAILCCIKCTGQQTNQTRTTSVAILMQELLISIIQNCSLSRKVLYSLKNKNKSKKNSHIEKVKIKQWNQILFMHPCLGIWSTFMWLYRFLSLCPLQMHISQKPCHSDLHSWPSEYMFQKPVWSQKGCE